MIRPAALMLVIALAVWRSPTAGQATDNHLQGAYEHKDHRDELPGLIRSPTEYVDARAAAPASPAHRAAAAATLGRQARLERWLLDNGATASGASRRHHHMFPYDARQQAAGRQALLQLEISRLAGNRSGAAARWCPLPPAPDCPTTLAFRTADGSCNNPVDGRLGMAGRPLLRLMRTRYDDGVFAARSRAAGGGSLPSARLVSQAVTTDDDAADARFTLSVMQLGQFIDHDVTLTPMFTLAGGAAIACCTPAGLPIAATQRHAQCLPIAVPVSDPFYGPLGRRCMNFVRSLPAAEPFCSGANGIGAQQSNVITHYLDNSNVYGSDAEHQHSLRLLSGGRLRTQAGGLLPAAESGQCLNANATVCFEAGDERVNEQVGLSLMHTIWMREHNRVAGRLAARHPQWDDERLFHQARRIVIGEMQHISYGEWLPTLVPADYLAANGLRVGTGAAYSIKYRPEVTAAISNEFATAAYRFGHSLVSGVIKLFGQHGASSASVLLRNNFINPHLLHSAAELQGLARGLAAQRAQAMDRSFATDLTEHLFQAPGDSFGLDLVALNVQRGRDHGLATYNDARVATGRPRAHHWHDLLADMPVSAVHALRTVYGHVDDVDLFVGGMLERPLPGVVLGRTFGHIVGDQFIRLRYGDNFFYDLGGVRPWRLAPAQLAEIRCTSWARVLCDNVVGISRIQPNAFLVAGGGNAVTYCANIPSVNLDQW